MNTEDALEAAYIKLLSEGIVSDSIFLSKNKFSDLNSRHFLTMTVYYSDIFNDDDFMMSHLGLFKEIVDFCSKDGLLDDKIALKIKDQFNA